MSEEDKKKPVDPEAICTECGHAEKPTTYRSNPMSEEDKKKPVDPEAICTECGHAEKHHSIDDDGWSSCDADNWSCNCGNNIGR